MCIQPLVSHIAREQQDYTSHKTDEADFVVIARLAAELHCHLHGQLDETWAHLRHLGYWDPRLGRSARLSRADQRGVQLAAGADAQLGKYLARVP